MDELIIVGDRVLIEAEEAERQTKAGLYLPATVADRDRVQGGRVIKVGPGHLMPNPDYSDAEPWAKPQSAVRFLPLQAQPGDFAFFLRKESVEITFQDHPYLIVPHHAILALVRDTNDKPLKSLGDLFE